MREFAEPLPRRLYRAKWMRDRYWNDSEWRLAEVNRKRAYCGLPPLASVDEIQSRRGA